jgi:hypothetical protein
VPSGACMANAGLVAQASPNNKSFERRERAEKFPDGNTICS